MQTMLQKKMLTYIIVICTAVTIFYILWTTKIQASNSIVQMTVNYGTVTIGSTGILNLWSITTDATTGIITGQYPANSFWVQDLKGWTGGYTTTIQSTDLEWQIWWVTYTIAATNIYMRTASRPVFISWYENTSVHFWWEVWNQYHNYAEISNPVIYFYKDSDGLTWGIYSTYTDAPLIGIEIPPFQPATTYQATLIFTLTTY